MVTPQRNDGTAQIAPLPRSDLLSGDEGYRVKLLLHFLN